MASVKQQVEGTADKSFLKLLAHPLRCRCQTYLCERTASPNELANKFDEPIGNVAYHFRVLEEHDCIELVDTAQRRGATEHYYRATQRTELSEEQYAALSTSDRLDFTRESVRLSMTDALTSLAETTFVQRADHQMTRQLGHVDEEGWGRLRDVFAEAFEKVDEEIAGAAARRVNDPERAAIPIRVVAMLFEMPPSDR
jgi:DNA-binding transcriptional ArsR family regulator